MLKIFTSIIAFSLFALFGSTVFAQTENFTITSVVQNGGDLTFTYNGYPGGDCSVILLRGNVPEEGPEQSEQTYAADNTCSLDSSGTFTLTPESLPDRYYIILVGDANGNTSYSNNFPIIGGQYPVVPTATPTNTPTPTVVLPTATPTPILVGPPTDKEQCKNGGWKAFNNPTFKNQGDCVSYTNHH